MQALLLWILFTTSIMTSFAAASSSKNRLALVSGSNKGIGKEISRKLLRNGCDVIVACRNAERGSAAAVELNQEGGGKAFFLPLDVSNSDSIRALKQTVERDFGKIDILVNNAATAFKGSDPTPFQQQARPTIMTNFFGLLELTRSLLPLLKLSDDPCIVNIASQAGHLQILPSQQRKEMFTSPTLTIPQLEGLMREFVADVEAGQHQQKGWPNTCYGTSKLGVIALTKILAREEPSIMVNCCCPGFCATDMSSHRGTRSAEHGARTPAYLALYPTGAGTRPTGKFFLDEKEITW